MQLVSLGRNPEYMLIDTSTDWDARYWLTNREEFIDGLQNMEKTHVIQVSKSMKQLEFIKYKNHRKHNNC